MPFDLTIPQSGGTSLNLTLNAGQNLFVLGANGTGKSSLMHRFFTAHNPTSRRITAHRQTWFESNAVTLTGEARRNTENNMRNSDMSTDARWKDQYAASRSSIAIYDLIDSENVRARAITKAVDDGDLDLAKTLSKKDAPIKIINELPRLSNLPIEISVVAGEQVMASKSGSGP